MRQLGIAYPDQPLVLHATDSADSGVLMSAAERVHRKGADDRRAAWVQPIKVVAAQQGGGNSRWAPTAHGRPRSLSTVLPLATSSRLRF
jgi:hypothetical protein